MKWNEVSKESDKQKRNAKYVPKFGSKRQGKSLWHLL
jgi:hypothetical protein